MPKKKIAIIGRGTAGVLATAHYARWCPEQEIVLYYDSNIKPQPVGEGSNLAMPKALFANLNFMHSDLDKIDGSFKYGIRKMNWSDGKDFVHHFVPPAVSYHFSADALQNYILNEVKDKVKIIDKNVTHDEIDADFIMDCSGKPSNYDDFHMSEYIPVNSVHVTQCYWDVPRFQYTLTIARPYGWVFGIPLQNRCSIGYMYNNNINTLEEVKEDVKNVFEQFNLIPSDKTNTFSFKNYYRKNNFTDRVIYNGNSSFFLEPLEATSIGVIDYITRLSYDMWFFGSRDAKNCNARYDEDMKEIETLIMLHYMSGSTFNTPFWDFAKEKGLKNIKKSLKNKRFVDFIEASKNKEKVMTDIGPIFGSWGYTSFNENLTNLNLYDRLEKLRAEA